MNVSMLVRRGGALLVLAVATACSDGPSAPTAAPRTLRDAADARAGYAVISAKVRSSTRSQTIVDFVIDPRSDTRYVLGGHAVSIPAYTICDPASSGYSPAVWDAPCTPLTTPIAMTALITSDGGHAAITFSPDLRFVPSNDQSRWVVLTLTDHRTINALRTYQIAWYNPFTKKWVDESLTDPTLKAWTNRKANTVSRRLKHFSGYNIVAGSCDPVLDPSCSPTGAL